MPKDGKYIDIETDKEILLANGAIKKMVTLLASIKDEDYSKFAEEKRKKVLEIGSILFIRLPMSNQAFFQSSMR
jgi:hypothetical protein